jgi:hypothetical protein
VGYLILHQDLTLTFSLEIFFVRSLTRRFTISSSPLIHGAHSQYSLGAILTLFSLTMETLATQVPDGYWFQPQIQCPKYPFNSLSTDFQTRNTNSLTTTKGLLSPYDNNPLLFLPSMGSSDIQQQQRINASQQPFPQPTQQDFMHNSGHCSSRSPLTLTYCPSSSPAPSNRISPLSTYSHSNEGQQNDRLFKCDQCPQSFDRNHDLKRHKRIHLAVKPFPCKHCEKSFSRKDALKVRSLFDLIRKLEQGDS